MAVSPYDNTPPESKTPAVSEFTGSYAQVISLRGNEPLYLPDTQGIEGISGSESFEDFLESNPAPASLNGNDLGGDIIISDFIENWQQDPVNFSEFSNQRVQVKEVNGKKGILLYGTHTDTGLAYGDASANQSIGPSQIWFPIKSGDFDWQSLRFGALIGLDRGEDFSPINHQGRLKIGLSNQPTSKYQFRRFEGEIFWGTLTWNVGNLTWNTSDSQFWRGGFQEYSNAGAPDYGMNITYSNVTSSSAQYLDFMGRAGFAETGLFIEFEKAGPDPAVDGLNIKMIVGDGTPTLSQHDFETQMKKPLNGFNQSGYYYKNIGNIKSDSGSWSDFNHLCMESWIEFLWIGLVAYQKIST